MNTKLIPAKNRTAFIAVLLVFFICLNSSAFGQWQLIGQFPSSVGQPVAFQPLFGDSILLVGFEDGAVCRTTNAGKAWQQIPVNAWVSDFAFKNDSEGWLSNEGGLVDLVYHTTDAGLTWTSVPIPNGTVVYGEETEIIYQPSTKDILLLSWDTSNSLLRSTDEGLTWQSFGPRPLFGGLWYGMAFTNDHHAIYGFPVNAITPRVFVTDDNWNTWTTVSYPNDGEVWQPLAIPGTDTIISISEMQGWETSSLDGGYTWTWLPVDTTIWMTGSPTWCDCGSVILSQEVPGFKPGVLYSLDLGSNWVSVGGPSNYYDTRIFYSGHYIYAGSYIDSNSYEVWRYAVHHYPTITYPGPLQTCSPLDTSFHISFTNTCFGIAASLDSVAFSGSANFQLQQLATPLTLANEQDIGLHYAPQPGSHDTAWVHLYFNQHGDRKDTILQFVGSGPEADRVSLHLAPSATDAQPGKTFSMDVFPDASISDAGLDTISFTLHYWNDLLSLENPPAPITVQNGEASVPIIIVGNNLTLDPSQPITTLNFEAMLTDTLHTTLALTSPIANPSDPSYTLCVLSLTADSTPFSLDLACGDSTILASWNETPPFSIQSIVPNPAQNEIRVSVTGLAISGMGVEMFDMLGRQQNVKPTLLPNEIVVDVSSIPAGTYYLRLAASGYVHTRKVSIER